MNPITLITGGSRGLGAALAEQLAAEGHDLILSYQSNEVAALAVQQRVEALGRKAWLLRLDLADSAAFPAFAERVGELLRAAGASQLAGLVQNAGFGVHAAYADTREADFDALVAVHLRGPFFLTQALLPLLGPGSRVLNVSSGLTRFSVPGYAAYAAVKGAVEVLTRYQAKELAARGISVNTLAPGATATDFGGGAVRDNAALNAQLATVTALGRVGQAEDIAGATAALLRPGAGWITGQRIEASGGMFL